jgi:hypothetical protein
VTTVTIEVTDTLRVMKTAVCMFVLCTSLSRAARAESSGANSVATTTNVPMMTFSTWLNDITNGTASEREAAVSFLHSLLVSTNGALKDRSSEAEQFRKEWGQFVSPVRIGKSTPEQFEAFCRVVDILVSDYSRRLKKRDDVFYAYRLAIRTISGNLWPDLERWQKGKEKLRAEQPWSSKSKKPDRSLGPRQTARLLPTQWTERVNAKSEWVDLPGYGHCAFVWGFLPGATGIWSEPGCGVSCIDILKQSPDELVFKITTNYGLPLNLTTGKIMSRPEAVGKVYKARISQSNITSVTEAE